MKTMNTLATIAWAVITIAALGACSPTNNGSNNAASTPAVTGTTCPAAGYYYGTNGQMLQCTPGQVVSTNYYPPTSSYYQPPSSSYAYQQAPAQGLGCAQYLYQWPYQTYVPMYINGQLQCVNYNMLVASAQQTPAYSNTNYAMYGAQYYYQYPPYTYTGSGGCGTSIAISYDGFSGAACF